MKLRVGTRGSKLALAQCGQICAAIEQAVGVECELVTIKTTGDKVTDKPLRDSGGKGLFVKELDEALLDASVDFAVHSLKDVPTELPDGVRLAVVPERAEPHDVLLSVAGYRPEQLPRGALVGTTSLRRQAQLLAASPEARVGMLRGNIDTRLAKLVAGDFDATFLAAAGLARLGVSLGPVERVDLDPFEFVPSPGQGALGITVRDDAGELSQRLSAVDDAETHAAVTAEREAARLLGGSCHLPVGVFGRRRGEDLVLVGLVADASGERVVRRHEVGSISDPCGLGRRLGDGLLSAGAAEIIAEIEEGEGA